MSDDYSYDQCKWIFHRFNVQCLSKNLLLKRAEIIREECESNKTIKKRKLYIERCKEHNVDHQKNCVFIDEAGFNLHIMRNRAWAPKNKPAKVKVPTQKGTSITIMGRISSAGSIDISKRNPGVYKKRKVPGTSNFVRAGKGTNTDHILIFVKNMLM